MAYVDLEANNLRLRLSSSHLPHAENLEEVYEYGLLAIEEVVADARRSRKMNIIGIDANAVVGRQMPTDDGHIIGAYGGGQRN